jgi:hypothetical protein
MPISRLLGPTLFTEVNHLRHYGDLEKQELLDEAALRSHVNGNVFHGDERVFSSQCANGV